MKQDRVKIAEMKGTWRVLVSLFGIWVATVRHAPMMATMMLPMRPKLASGISRFVSKPPINAPIHNWIWTHMLVLEVGA
jgi:hypothetical protein